MQVEPARTLAAERLAHDITRWLFSGDVLSPGLAEWPTALEMTEDADREMMDRIRNFEEGRIRFADLEAAGMRYAEAWMQADEAFRARKVA